MNSNDAIFLRKSFQIAAEARRRGDHPFGAILVIHGRIVAEGANSVCTERDPTRHAELSLVSKACAEISRDDLANGTLFCSTEPCAMCAGAIYWSGIRRVVFGCSARNLGRIAGGELVIPCVEVFQRGLTKTEVVGPMLEDEAILLHQGFWK